MNRDRGDSVGMNITVYADDGSYMKGFVVRTELVVPQLTAKNDDEEDDDADANADGDSANVTFVQD